MSESESLWNAIDFLQRAFQDQPELFGSRSMESLFGTGTALYDATKRLVPDSGNAVAATERGLEYAPLIASALVECVFFDAGVPGPIRKAHELWTAARVQVCKNHVAGHQFEAQRSAAANAESDDAPGHARDDRDGSNPRNAPGAGGSSSNPAGADNARDGDGTGGRDDDSGNTDRRTRRRLAADGTTAPSLGPSRTSPPVAPATASSSLVAASAARPTTQSSIHGHGVDARTEDDGASGALAPSGASTGTQ